ncbi:MAG TPA: nucleotide-binding protein [Casimicrobiaceae bacterium]|nr:nucleotide-binding protein [Casimicrobiaceae bacterium]
MRKQLLVAGLLAALAVLPSGAVGEATAAISALKGEVLEVIDVEAYTYLRLKMVDGEMWAAVNKSSVKKGAEVTINDPVVMENFKSPALNRTFPEIVFGTLGTAAPAAAPAAPSAAPHGAADVGQIHAGVGKSIVAGSVKVARAEGASGRTVAEVNANRLALKDKTVTIRAQVVKVNANVMGKNWVHLRDGSGNAADASNDLLVTSKEEPKVGDVVIAKGVVETDVDLGSGYTYKVLVENVSFGK